jgi:hypothetical protein
MFCELISKAGDSRGYLLASNFRLRELVFARSQTSAIFGDKNIGTMTSSDEHRKSASGPYINKEGGSLSRPLCSYPTGRCAAGHLGRGTRYRAGIQCRSAPRSLPTLDSHYHYHSTRKVRLRSNHGPRSMRQRLRRQPLRRPRHTQPGASVDVQRPQHLRGLAVDRPVPGHSQPTARRRLDQSSRK